MNTLCTGSGHTHKEASKEGHNEIDARRVEKGYMVARVNLQFVHDVRSDPLCSLLELATVQLADGMTLGRDKDEGGRWVSSSLEAHGSGQQTQGLRVLNGHTRICIYKKTPEANII